jgi:hypothetical protein
MALAEQMDAWRKDRQAPAAAVFIEKTARPRLG